jgi:hypothetical protein
MGKARMTKQTEEMKNETDPEKENVSGISRKILGAVLPIR